MRRRAEQPPARGFFIACGELLFLRNRSAHARQLIEPRRIHQVASLRGK
jgi:hypothetical protein